MDVPRTLSEFWPGAAWRFSGEPSNYDALEWLDDSKKPTEADITEKYAELPKRGERAHELLGGTPAERDIVDRINELEDRIAALEERK